MKLYFLVILLFPLLLSAQTQNTALNKQLKKYSKFKIIRSSDDSDILVKYVDLYKSLGGELYIVMLQQKFKPTKTSDTTYTLMLAPQELQTIEDSPEWSDFLFCPIGKPNARITAVDEDNRKLQSYSYRYEAKNGMALWYDAKDSTVTTKFFYSDDALTKR